jgi:type VI protein secretion system component VasF
MQKMRHLLNSTMVDPVVQMEQAVHHDTDILLGWAFMSTMLLLALVAYMIYHYTMTSGSQILFFFGLQ